ncbi:MAG TPA: von Willebrand factor type A domain-containing protein [Opitutaceae bacterium]|nr:von Willebrand factor type A domain-containing protein [Opitutaceae bacterium]
MNDDNIPEMQKQIPAELEARVEAWVSGEASPSESAELERLTAGRPELAALKARIEAVRKLVSEAVSPDSEPLRLSAARRESLLQSLGAPGDPAAREASDAPGFPTLASIVRRQRNERRWVLAIAACLTCGLFLSVMFQGSYQRQYAASRNARMESLKKAPEQLKLEVELPASAAAEPAEPASAPNFQAPAAIVLDETQKDKEATSRTVAAMQSQFAQESAAAVSRDLAASGTNAGSGGIAANGAAPSGGGENAPLAHGDRFALVSGNPAPALSLSAGRAPRAQAKGAAAAPVENEEPTALEPFVVSGLEDKGSYKANSTLAGTRVRTDLNDVASSISVVTSEFLQDTKAAGAPSPAESDDMAKAAPLAPAKTLAGAGLEEAVASREPVSTFSLHVGDVSFRLAQAALARGEAPDPGRIRPEEFYNAFSYGDPAPAMAEKIACRTEQSADPTMQQRNLLRIAMTVPATGRAAAQSLRLTALLDTSGSMEREDRAAAVRRAMEVLVSLLGKDDRVTLVGFARRPRLLADQVPGDKAAKLLDIIAHTPAEGGTNMEEAIKIGGELAMRQYAPAAQNRLVILTDGAANLGDADPAHLAALVETLRQKGLAFDACGVGTDGIDDSVLEALTRKGSGRYYVLDTPEAADAGFARQLAGAFRPAAENVKVQVRFNPARVGSYRLIGFERHRLNKEDFRNDKVAAAALAAGEAAVALYEVEALPQGEGELGEVHVRFHDTASGAMVERSWTLPYDPYVPAFDRATPTMQLAGTAAFLAEKLRGGARGEAIKLTELAPVVNALRSHYAHEARVQELAAMYERMRRMRME